MSSWFPLFDSHPTHVPEPETDPNIVLSNRVSEGPTIFHTDIKVKGLTISFAHMMCWKIHVHKVNTIDYLVTVAPVRCISQQVKMLCFKLMRWNLPKGSRAPKGHWCSWGAKASPCCPIPQKSSSCPPSGGTVNISTGPRSNGRIGLVFFCLCESLPWGRDGARSHMGRR